jgi:hypothetical protein
MENEEEIIVDDTEQTDNQEETLNDTEQDLEKEELKKKLATIEAQKDHWRKKAQEKKEDKHESSINPKDLYALMQSSVHEDDIDDVAEYAKFKKISIAEALKTDVVKTILSNKAEFRETAQKANTGAARRGATKLSDDVLLANAAKGDIPAPGTPEAEQLFWAKRGGKR